MKKALVTLACGHFFEQLGTITHPTLAAYAKKIGADFVVWRDAAGHAIPHYKKLDLARLLDEYDRILYVDTDVIIRDDAPICSSWYRSTASAFSTKAPTTTGPAR